jgi:hypothetical protein
VPSPALTAAPQQTAVPTTGPITPIRAFLARDGLPPVAVLVDQVGPARDRPEQGILARLTALRDRPVTIPSGATNPLAAVRPRSEVTSQGTTQSSFELNARVDGDLATVEFGIGDWGARGAAQTEALVRQLVYTITEEAGIRRALIKEKGKPNAVIDQLVIDKPLSREDVFGYPQIARTTPLTGFGSRPGARAATTSWSVDAVAPGLARFVVAVDQRNVGPNEQHPDFQVDLVRNDESVRPDLGKWKLVIQVYGIADTTTVNQLAPSPLRVVERTTAGGPPPATPGPTIYQLGLDDARPWRTALLFDPVRIVVDVGGPPTSVAPTTAVYGPRPGDVVGRMFSVSGVASAFEAHVDWRVRDQSGRVVSSYGTTGTNCCEPGGVYETIASVPESFTGAATLEVFQTSGKDGSDAEVVKIPISIRPAGGIDSPPAIPTALFKASGGPYRGEADAIRSSTYQTGGKADVMRDTYALLARFFGIRTYQIDPGREIYLVRVAVPMTLPVRCASVVKVIDATDGSERATLCGEMAWPTVR